MGRKKHRKAQKKYNTHETIIELTGKNKEKYEEFIKTTLDKDTFIIQNVAEDNACFYRSISNGLYHIVDCEGDTGGDVFYSIGKWKSEINGHKTIQNSSWGYRGSEQTYLAKKVQQIARKWLIENSDKYVNNIPGYKVVDLVRDSHGFDISDNEVVMALYDVCYAKFAGRENRPKLTKKQSDDDIISQMDNEIESLNYCAIDSDDESAHTVDESTSFCESDNDDDDNNDEELLDLGFEATSRRHEIIKSQITDKYNISDYWDRWGSGAEAYALSAYFKVPIIIYAAKQFNFKNGRIQNGRMNKGVKPDKNVRFQVLQIWGDEFMGMTPPIELLYKKVKGNIEHYMVLYRNDVE